MLKEQDDPLSMLGKASDDSVLFPKRASRGSAADRSKSGLGSGSAFFFDGFKLNPGDVAP
jgi:hypothetical protein